MWEFQWLRRYIRRNTRKIPVPKAVNWKQRLSVMYMIFAWNAFGTVLYMCYTGRHDWMRSGGYTPDVDIPPARSWAHTLGIKNAKVIRVSGFKIEGTYEIREDDGFDYEGLMNKNQKKINEDKELVSESEKLYVTGDN